MKCNVLTVRKAVGQALCDAHSSCWGPGPAYTHRGSRHSGLFNSLNPPKYETASREEQVHDDNPRDKRLITIKEGGAEVKHPESSPPAHYSSLPLAPGP